MNARREFPFVQVDVFTDRIFGGNPLAVFPYAEGLTQAQMQAVAKEMNLSETTFVLPPTRPDCAARVRIFTPARELQFAGHPTVGTSYVLATHGLLSDGAVEIVLEEGVGPVPVRFEGDPREPRFIWMTHPEATFGPPVENRAAIAAALGVDEGELIEDAPIQVGSTGSAFLYVPLRHKKSVDKAQLNVPLLLQAFNSPTAVGVFIFAPGPNPSAGRVYSRMFAPHTSGIPEDPATGSASGPLGVYLLKHGLVTGRTDTRIVSEQGTRMGRQSFVHINVRHNGSSPAEIEVGGSVVPVLEGVLRLP